MRRLLVLGAAVLLLVDTFLPWQRLSIGPFSYSWNAWHGDKGVLLGVMTIALVLWVGAGAAGVPIPARINAARATPALAVLVLVFAVAKNVRDDDSAWGGYAGVALAAVVLAGSVLEARRPSPTAPA